MWYAMWEEKSMLDQPRQRVKTKAAPQRSALLPDVPTMHEVGLTNFELAPWWGVYFPAATPAEIVSKVGKWMNQISATEDAAKFLATVGSFPMTEDGPTAAARLQADIKLWAPIVQAAKIEPQ